MKLLIDTQVFIWLINGDERLGSRAQGLLSDTANRVSVSYFSFWEMAIKASIGKLHYDPSVLEDLPKVGFDLIMPDEHSLRNYTVYDSSNKDPFDNTLITVARSEKCAFVTGDPRILAVRRDDLRLVDARK